MHPFWNDKCSKTFEIIITTIELNSRYTWFINAFPIFKYMAVRIITQPVMSILYQAMNYHLILLHERHFQRCMLLVLPEELWKSSVRKHDGWMDSDDSKERFGSLHINSQSIMNSLALFLHIKKDYLCFLQRLLRQFTCFTSCDKINSTVMLPGAPVSHPLCKSPKSSSANIISVPLHLRQPTHLN